LDLSGQFAPLWPVDCTLVLGGWLGRLGASGVVAGGVGWGLDAGRR